MFQLWITCAGFKAQSPTYISIFVKIVFWGKFYLLQIRNVSQHVFHLVIQARAVCQLNG